MVNQSTRKAQFEVIYGRTLRLAVDLAALPKLPGASVASKHLAERVKATQEGVCQHLEESYAKYKTTTNKGRRSKIFREGDHVMVHLCKGQLATGAFGKLINKKYGPCKILKKINYNAYVVDPPEDFAISSTFNVADIFEYFPLEDLKLNSRMSSFQEEEIDARHAVPTKKKKNSFIYLFYNLFLLRIRFTIATRNMFTITTRIMFTLFTSISLL
jgi:hypothetical protein